MSVTRMSLRYANLMNEKNKMLDKGLEPLAFPL